MHPRPPPPPTHPHPTPPHSPRNPLQPEIIDNQKGLLVSFRLVSAQLDLDPVIPSLALTIGDITPGHVKVVRFTLVTSLQGTFSNFNATYQEINPLGDPSLSLLHSLEYFQVREEQRREGRRGGRGGRGRWCGACEKQRQRRIDRVRDRSIA